MRKQIAIATLFFLVGSGLHLLAQVDHLARTPKNNQPDSRVQIFLARWQIILVREAWAIAFFAFWLQGQLVAFLTAAKIPVPDLARAVLDLHVGGAVAFVAGFFADSALGYIPKLDTQIPPPIDSKGDAGNGPPVAPTA